MASETKPQTPAHAKLDQLLAEIRAREAVIRQGGGKRGIERQHKHGRLTARERIELLCDRDQAEPFFELGLWAAEGMYEDVGGVPAAGVVVGLARICGRLCIVVANDATVKAGAFFPATCKKVIRAQRWCMDNRLPIIYLVDSAGVFLPMQDEVFPDEDDFGRIFRHNAVISAMGIPQFSAIMGNCVAGGGYLPVMCDKLLMTEGSGLYLAGPALVKAAIGQKVSHEDLGGAKMHASISGTIDYREVNDELCIERLRRLIGTLGVPPACPFDRAAPVEPKQPAESIYDTVAHGKRGEYDIRDLLQYLLDADTFDEYKAEYGQSLVCGWGRLDGWAVGIVANQKRQVRPARGPIQFPSVIYTDSADKAARFILDCSQLKTPIIFIQDVNGFMVGRDSEEEGIIRSGAKMVNAVSNTIVPKLTVITGGSFGAGNYAMCGKAYDPRFIFAWPTARYAVMGGYQAATTLLQLEVANLKKKGHEPDEAEMNDLHRRVSETYEQRTDIRYGAARGWVDAIIAPAHTRKVLALALEAVSHVGELPPLKTGVFQV
jgi:3-methylcrotonyl-CoA carboxylase beta subunit